jgi:hypothetical protein
MLKWIREDLSTTVSNQMRIAVTVVGPTLIGLGHIAIQEQLNGKTVDWKEKVSDEQCEIRNK